MAWYRDWLADGKVAKARSAVSRLRELFRFGRSILEDSECDRLFESLGKVPLQSSPPRTVQMTADHARAICETAHTLFGWHSIALAQALQFELLLGQKDVIGEWVPVTEPGESDIIWEKREKKWLRGLRWSDIDKNLILRHTVGSSGRRIEVDLRTAPMVLEELEFLVAAPRRTASSTMTLEDLGGSLPRSGPIVYCEINGMPWSTAEFGLAQRNPPMHDGWMADYASLIRPTALTGHRLACSLREGQETAKIQASSHIIRGIPYT